MYNFEMPARRAVPIWFITFADLMALLLCLFAALLSMNHAEDRARVAAALRSIRGAFGGSLLETPSPGPEIDRESALLAKLFAIPGQHDSAALSSTAPLRVSLCTDGVLVEIDGDTAFPDGGVRLSPQGSELLRGVADRLRGGDWRLTIRGHANDPLEPDERADVWHDLSYARARAAASALSAEGLEAATMRIEALGATDTKDRSRAKSARPSVDRRLEILVTEDSGTDGA